MARRRNDEDQGMLIGGMIVLGVGLLFLFMNLGWIPDLGKMWPLFPIIVGIALIFGGLRGRQGRRDRGESRHEAPPAPRNDPDSRSEPEATRAREY